jgi:ribosomal protein L16 Arg81 hydroxylase
MKAVVKEGQTLYIPSGWWHFVVNLTDTIAINHWWRSQPAPSANNHVSSAPHRVSVHENAGDDIDTLRRLQKEIEQLNREMISCLKSIKTSAACQR